ncbi:immunity 53 family protein [Methylomonas sp. UP202]|uniref:immunity 53 family protein n=1 Tax=Methylomonas sp. UP202 TaxID=3040943 RepID=UPI001438ED0F|nr:immunity 53 family protein [Methylomonas sp. UP202]NJA06626.1 rhodanese-related sulfurtransferase [Methylococcaceae bacterium WWC4]WGS86889.1 immunity 53 family protein [Methylomonas sp. UP202]
MNIDNDLINSLERWYLSMCNDDWEHTYGIFISNIDNPGWCLKVELSGTNLEEVYFEDLMLQREDENDWIICKVENGTFIGYGGPKNLKELINTFLVWSERRAVGPISEA